MRRVGAVALFGVGLVHLEQYAFCHYAAVPTVGTLFVANFVSATVLACLLAGRDGLLLRAGGIAVAAGSLAGLVLAEHGGLFGFTESGYRPVIVVAVALELLTITCLAARSSTARAGARASPRGRPG